MSDSASTARALVSHLVACGVRTFVLCPGSRSAPLAYALYDAERAGAVRLHIETDERVAGFAALGSGSVGELAAVVTTSGSAVANLHPAVEEAFYGGVPMIVVSCDRPEHMRGVRASQTTDHRAVLAGSVRHFRELPAGAPPKNLGGLVQRAVRAARGAGNGTVPGPVHLNVGFVEPLMPDQPWKTVDADIAQAQRGMERGSGERCVVVAGTTRNRKLDPALFAGIPILAEPSAALRAHPNTINAHPILLGTDLRAQITRAIVIGHPTLTREISGLLADPAVDVVVLDDAPTYADVAGNARIVNLAGLAGECEPNDAWLNTWRIASVAADNWLMKHCAGLDFCSIARDVSTLSGHTELVLGASTIIRDVNLYAPVPARPVHANRGLAGIDGTMSTGIGIGIATGRPVRVVLGDLTFIHDLGALVRTASQAHVDLDVVILDDSGGSLFATLEYGAGDRDAYDRVFRTAKEIDVRAYAAAVGADYAPVSEREELRTALEQTPRGTRIIHVKLGACEMQADRARRAALRDSIRDHVHLGLNSIQ